jgi:uncharacterized cupredoxin-like copper-binding protein
MRRVGLACALVSAISAAAISSGCGGGGSATGAENPPPTGAGSTKIGNAVRATEAEWNVASTPPTVKAGRVRFTVANQGKKPHELVIVETDRKANDLLKGKEADEIGKVGELEDIKAGKTLTKSVSLKPGHYALICNLPGHYKAGMYADLEVR